MLRIDRAMSVALARARAMTRQRPDDPHIPILMYHSISEDLDEERHPYFRIVTSPETFQRHVQHLIEMGWASLTLREVRERLEQSPESNEKGVHTERFCPKSLGCSNTSRYVAITFDDAYQDFLTKAYPILSNAGLTATVFVATEFIGRDFLNGRRCLDAREIAQLSSCGVEFGSHTASHPKLYYLSRKDRLRELCTSKQILEDITGASVTSFSYPFKYPIEDTEFTRNFQNELEETGYSVSVSTTIGRARPGVSVNCLPRLPINEMDDIPLFCAKLNGAYDWMAPCQRLFKLLKSRTKMAR